MSSLIYASEPATLNTYIVDTVDDTVRNAGSYDMLVVHLIDFLRTNFPKFKQSSTSSGTSIDFHYTYPEDRSMEWTVPAVFIDIKDDYHEIDSIGYVQAEVDGENIYVFRVIANVEFDIWANSSRQKKIIAGVLYNLLHSGIIDFTLRRKGIQFIKYRRSVPRGYDQTDRVLQFHTHQLGSDEIYRDVVEIDIGFDHRIVWLANDPQGTIYSIKNINLDIDGEDWSLVDNLARQEVTLDIA